MSYRIPQVNELLTREVGYIIAREIDVRDQAMITVKRAEVSDDLEYSKIWVSIFPEQHAKRVLETLTRNVGRVQYILNRRVQMRFVPRIDFRLDISEKKATHIRQLIIKTRKKDDDAILYKTDEK